MNKHQRFPCLTHSGLFEYNFYLFLRKENTLQCHIRVGNQIPDPIDCVTVSIKKKFIVAVVTIIALPAV